MTLFDVAKELSRRLTAAFLRDGDGRRAIYGGTTKFQDDPHWRDLILFHEYFHGDNGAGLGATHQTGWTGLVAPLLDFFGRIGPKDVLETERARLQTRIVLEQVAGERRRRRVSESAAAALSTQRRGPPAQRCPLRRSAAYRRSSGLAEADRAGPPHLR